MITYTPDLLNERTATGKQRWLAIKESPFSRAATYEAIRLGWFESVVLKFPGSKRERRFIDSESIDRHFRKLLEEQKGSDTFSVRTPRKKKGPNPD